MSRYVARGYRLLRGAAWCLPLWVNAAGPAPAGYQPPPMTAPAGFAVELAASPPLVDYPMMACFDERGRLFIAESAGFNLDEKQLAERRPNFIRMLEDTDGDGRFDKSTIFADRLMIPNGVLWHQGALYVAEPPGIWRYTDADGDGVADKREHIAGNVRSNGMSSTLHGPTLHPSGRLFWCSGQGGYSLDKDREPPPGRIAPGVFSLKVDGSEHEVYAIGGMANPVEVTFNDEGEAFGTIAILGRYDGQRNDSLMHWVYGGIYAHNKNDPVPLKRTGPDLPALSRVGQVAPAGLEHYRSGAFGAEFRGNIFWSQFNTHRVVRTRIQRDGATFRAQDEDFLTSEHVDFHPTDVLEDADGSLLVINTGGWFRHGCPTSHIAKPDARGAIFRIRRVGAPNLTDPRGLKLNWAQVAPGELTPRLSDPRPAVQDRGIATLALHGDASIDSLRQLLRASQSVVARRNAVWTLARVDTPAARTGIRDATRDPEATVRQAAVNALGWARDQPSVARLSELLSDSQTAIRREAATALGRIRDERAVGALLGALRTAGDAFLQHSLIFALIQIERPELIVAGLADENAGVRRGALLALGQMEKVALTREQIAPLLRAEDVELQRAAFSVAARAPALRDELMVALRALLNEPPAVARAELIRETLSGLVNDAAVQHFVVELLDRKESHPQVKVLLIDAMRQSGVRQFPASWLAAIGRELRTGAADVRLAVIALARERSAKAIDSMLQEIAVDGKQAVALRAACLDAVAARLAPVPPELFAFAGQRLDRSDTPAAKLAAARTMAALTLSNGQLTQLAARLPATEPLILPTLLRAFARSTNDAVGTALVAALERTPATQSVTSDELVRLLRKYPTTTQTAAKPLLARLGVDLEKQKAHLEELSAHLAGGDIGRGQQIFFGKAACAACHRVSGQGGLIGPNLTGIAEVRTGRDLLESVIYPSASIVQGYQPFNVQTRDGQSYSGLLVRQAPDAVWLRGADQAEVKVDAQRIVSMTESTVSLMPQGLDATLSRDEFRDLLAYLQSLKRLSSAAAERPGAQ